MNAVAYPEFRNLGDVDWSTFTPGKFAQLDASGRLVGATVDLSGYAPLSGAVFTGPVQLADGTAAAPSLAFASDPDTGLYRVGANTLGVAARGKLVTEFYSAGGAVGYARTTTYLPSDYSALAVGMHRFVASNGTTDLGGVTVLEEAGPTYSMYLATGNAGDVSRMNLEISAKGTITLRPASGSPVYPVTIPLTPQATANYGLLSLGAGAFNGTTSGYFVGSASGTHLAVNTASGFAGNFLDFQVAGAARFRVSYRGSLLSASTGSPTDDNTRAAILVQPASARNTYYSAFEYWDNGGSFPLFKIGATGSLLMGNVGTDPAVNSFLAVNQTDAVDGGGSGITAQYKKTASTSFSAYGVRGTVLQESASASSGNRYGGSFDAWQNGAGAVTGTLYGVAGNIFCLGAGTVARAVGVRATVSRYVGAITQARGVSVDGWFGSTGITDAYGLYIGSDSVDLATGTKYAVYSAALAPSLLTGPLQLPDGTLSAPALTFAGETDNGLYRVGADTLGASRAFQAQGLASWRDGQTYADFWVDADGLSHLWGDSFPYVEFLSGVGQTYNGSIQGNGSKFGIYAGAMPLYVQGGLTSGAGPAIVLNNIVALTASGAKLVSVRNGGTEKAYFDKDGGAGLAGQLLLQHLGAAADTSARAAILVQPGSTQNTYYNFFEAWAYGGSAPLFKVGSNGVVTTTGLSVYEAGYGSRMDFGYVGNVEWIFQPNYTGKTLKFALPTAVVGENGSTANLHEWRRYGETVLSAVDKDGRLIIGGSALDAAAALQIDSTTKGLLVPRMTTTQRDAIATPPDGLVLYNSTTKALTVRANSAWAELGAGGGSLSGSGANGRLTFWTGASTLGSSSNILIDATNFYLGLRTAPQAAVHIAGNTEASAALRLDNYGTNGANWRVLSTTTALTPTVGNGSLVIENYSSSLKSLELGVSGTLRAIMVGAGVNDDRRFAFLIRPNTTKNTYWDPMVVYATSAATTPVFLLQSTGRLHQSAPASAPTDADLWNGSASFYLDEATNKLKVRVRYSDGTYKTGEVALA